MLATLQPVAPGQSFESGHALTLAALEKEGLDTLKQLDLLQSAAFFAWANRLMLTLGEPYLP